MSAPHPSSEQEVWRYCREVVASQTRVASATAEADLFLDIDKTSGRIEALIDPQGLTAENVLKRGRNFVQVLEYLKSDLESVSTTFAQERTPAACMVLRRAYLGYLSESWESCVCHQRALCIVLEYGPGNVPPAAWVQVDVESQRAASHSARSDAYGAQVRSELNRLVPGTLAP